MTNVLREQIGLKQTGSHTYTSSWHRDWTVGPSLHGGHVAAVVQLAAQTHLTTTLAAQNQPDVLTMHLDFLLACTPHPLSIQILDLKLGKGTSTIQLRVHQNDKLKVLAVATSINFDAPIGPSASTDWAFHPAPKPLPDFSRVAARKPDANWLPAVLDGEILPFTRRQLVLNPRGGFVSAGVCDAWNSFPGERMDATYLAMMSDCIPSMSDTLLHNEGPYDAQMNFRAIEAWAEKNPGDPAPLTNSFKDAARATIFNMTLTLDLEFKGRVPEEGLEWLFTRAATRVLRNGRMDLDVTLCDRNLEILCLARQTILALDAKRKFGTGKQQKTKSSL